MLRSLHITFSYSQTFIHAYSVLGANVSWAFPYIFKLKIQSLSQISGDKLQLPQPVVIEGSSICSYLLYFFLKKKNTLISEIVHEKLLLSAIYTVNVLSYINFIVTAKTHKNKILFQVSDPFEPLFANN